MEYDGKIYYFPGPEQKAKFLANPVKYAPALGGDCVVCLAKMNKRMPGNIRHGVLHAGRLFIFPNEEIKKEFLASPQTYADVDLAFGGTCSVCRVEMGKEVAGKPEFSTIYRKMRYLFPGEEQRQMFLANPAKYAVKPL